MIAYILILVGLLARLIPHVPNFVPVAAIALFAGAYLNKKYALWVPLLIMVLSDLIIGMHDVVLFTWGAFAVIALLGMFLKGRINLLNVFGGTIVAAILFYVVTNFGVWIAWYPKTWVGFIDCYAKAIPFFRVTLVGNAVFSFVLFGAYELAKKFVGETKYKKVLLASS